MKRYRVLAFDFDSRARILTETINDEWEELVKETWKQNRQAIESELALSYGTLAFASKRQNFIDLGSKPFSVLAFHNRFYEQVRMSFIMGSYYPALTGACTLGERILNHLILQLREDYKQSAEYKKVYRKDSFDNWDLAIDTLESWGVLLPEVVKKFRDFRNIRNQSIHFHPEVDRNDRELALTAIKCLSSIIDGQFCAFGPRPWFITSIPGEIYIKKDWESKPFIQKFYLPNSIQVGPKHKIESIHPDVAIQDDHEYENREISDDEFSKLRQ